MVPLVQVEGRKRMVLAVSEGQLIDLKCLKQIITHSSTVISGSLGLWAQIRANLNCSKFCQELKQSLQPKDVKGLV